MSWWWEYDGDIDGDNDCDTGGHNDRYGWKVWVIPIVILIKEW